MAEMIEATILASYLLCGLFFRRQETRHRPNCPRGFGPVMTTVLFWPYKVPVVFYKKWQRGR